LHRKPTRILLRHEPQPNVEACRKVSISFIDLYLLLFEYKQLQMDKEEFDKLERERLARIEFFERHADEDIYDTFRYRIPGNGIGVYYKHGFSSVFDEHQKFYFRTPHKIHRDWYLFNAFDNDYAIIEKTFLSEIEEHQEYDKLGLIHISGEITVPFIYDYFGEDFLADKYILAKKDGKYGYIDCNGNIMSEFKYDDGGLDREWLTTKNYETVRIGELQGVVNWECKEIIPVEFKDIDVRSVFSWETIKTPEMEAKALQEDKIECTAPDGKKYLWNHYTGLLEVDEFEIIE
jgi:hypothetical protein